MSTGRTCYEKECGEGRKAGSDHSVVPVQMSGALGGLLSRRRCKPLIEANFAKPGIVVGDKGSVIETRPEISRLGIGNDLPAVSGQFQITCDELVEVEAIRTSDFDNSGGRCTKRHIRHRISDIIGGDS